ncbi:uncharacterized protein JCM10292_003034 [Rhodotorula paludigena]|uniref:uncharacterized protein n=1 Tax=Rhodotorula paludigena TaxID=86838 RepID=UPI0031814952
MSLSTTPATSDHPLAPKGDEEAKSESLEETARAIRAGLVGASYGPYPRPSSLRASSFPSPTASSTAVDPGTPRTPLTRTGTSTSVGLESIFGGSKANLLGFRMRDDEQQSSSPASHHGGALSGFKEHLDDSLPLPPFLPRSTTVQHVSPLLEPCVVAQHPHLLWLKSNASLDDLLHDPSPEFDAALDRRAWKRHNLARVLDQLSLLVVTVVLVGLFMGWPVLRFGIIGSWDAVQLGERGATGAGGYGPGGINASGLVPVIPNLPRLVDRDTPLEAYYKTGVDGDQYEIVFSDEFNVDGRTFWPGDDPYWEAVDLRYDMEWYDPDAAITQDGKLVITLSQEPWNGMNFRSAMLQSWNKFCFTGGLIEVSASFPGNSRAMGAWPGVWTLGNLGRAGYGASVDGTWPYSYDSCDVGTLPNQTWPNGTAPEAARTSGLRDYGGSLSYLPGQRLSACTCPGEDHPGPNVNVGRGAPEIDVTEQQVDWRGTGSTSQSLQFAPMDSGYIWRNETPHFRIFNESRSVQNLFTGAVYQESASIITLTDETSYEGRGYTTFAFEYEPGPAGKITWFVNSTPSWQFMASAMGPNAETQIGQRLVSEEPMSINLNLAISPAFQPPDWSRLTFPGHLRIDYVRVYQKGVPRIGCDPPDHPTAEYIARHPDVYSNPNLTVFPHPFPKNRLGETGCT